MCYDNNHSDYQKGLEVAPSEYKRSRQRERMLEILRSTGSHPTATWLYNELKKDFPNLSMGTVYRNLSILMEQGLVKKHEFGSTFDHYEANTEPHYHFICEKCGRIIDLEISVDPGLEEQVRKTTAYAVHRHKLVFYGICDACSTADSKGQKGH